MTTSPDPQETKAATEPALETPSSTHGKRQALEMDGEDDTASHADSVGSTDAPPSARLENQTEAAATSATSSATTATATTSPDTMDESPKPAAKRRTLCGVCHGEAAKYKCPRCSLAYCSVACSKTHRDNHPPENDDTKKSDDSDPRTASSATDAPLPRETQETVSRRDDHPFSVLDDSTELKRLFAKYPRLPTRLRSIYDATLPSSEGGRQSHPNSNTWVRPGMRVGRVGRGGRGSGRDGRDGRDGRGGRGGGQRSSQPWTAEIGLRQGQVALRQARIDPGEDGDGVREYCELVTFLLSDDRGRGPFRGTDAMASNTAPVTSLVHQEVLQGDMSLIKQLMASEGR